MSEKRSWGSTVLGWFVEREGDTGPSPSDPEAIVAEIEAQTGPQTEPVRVELKGEVPLPAAASEPINLPAIYRAAGLDDEEQGRIARALTLLQTLPAETPAEVKRQIVAASLQAFGVPLQQIVEACVGAIEALHAYIALSQRHTQKIVSEGNDRIEALSREIDETRAAMEQKAVTHQTITGRCNEEKLKVQQVLEFFGQEEVARVVRESPKLHEPAPG